MGFGVSSFSSAGSYYTYDVVSPYLVFDEYPALLTYTLGSTFVFRRLMTSHVSPLHAALSTIRSSQHLSKILSHSLWRGCINISYIAGKKQKPTTAKMLNKTKSHLLLLFISRSLIRYESSRGHKIDGAKTKTNWEETRSEKNKHGKQTEESRRESSLQRTWSPGRDSEEKTKKQKTNNSSKAKQNKIAHVASVQIH